MTSRVLEEISTVIVFVFLLSRDIMTPSAISEETISSVSTLRIHDGPAENDKGTVVEGREKTPLEAISHGRVMPGISIFPDYTSHRRHILVHMAATFRFFARSGFTEGQSG